MKKTPAMVELIKRLESWRWTAAENERLLNDVQQRGAAEIARLNEEVRQLKDELAKEKESHAQCLRLVEEVLVSSRRDT